MRGCFLIFFAFVVFGCGENSDASVDAGPVDAFVPPPWPHTLPSTDELGEHGEFVVARTILHAHSPISHDACDGEGFVDGAVVDEECLQSLRDAVCALHIDTLNLTDHASHISELPFEELFLRRDTDDEVRNEDGALVATRIHCDHGGSTLVTVGSENELMPIGLTRHALDTTDAAALEAAYHTDGVAGAELFREAGALVLLAHTEQRDLEVLRTLGLDGLEIYNVHANVDPRIRPMWLGLGATDYLASLLRFTNAANHLEPDLSFLAFFSESENDLAKWDTLLSEGMHVWAIAGSDAHENSFPMRMPDGERGDSYRRMLRWFSNHLLVRERSYDGQREAMLAGRSYVAFEVFGTPVGFRFTADSETTSVEMGGTIAVGATLRVRLPELSNDMPTSEPPTISARIVRSIDMGRTEVHVGSGQNVTFTPTTPGAYRVEVRIVPNHARAYLGTDADALVRDYVWIYSNPIYVTP